MKIIILLLAICLNACAFAPGSYAFRKQYKLDSSFEDLKIAIKRLKTEFPTYKAHFKDDDYKVTKHFYPVYFHLEKEQFVLHCLISSSVDHTTSYISLYSYSTIEEYNTQYIINKDLKRKENKNIILLFETKVLNPLKALL
ncbi:MAG: hypothetical protein ACPGSD_07280 [Flavobacteriales bacterium]